MTKILEIYFVGTTIKFELKPNQVEEWPKIMQGIMEDRYREGGAPKLYQWQGFAFATHHLIGYRCYDRRQLPQEELLSLVREQMRLARFDMNEGEKWKHQNGDESNDSER